MGKKTSVHPTAIFQLILESSGTFFIKSPCHSSWLFFHPVNLPWCVSTTYNAYSVTQNKIRIPKRTYSNNCLDNSCSGLGSHVSRFYQRSLPDFKKLEIYLSNIKKLYLGIQKNDRVFQINIENTDLEFQGTSHCRTNDMDHAGEEHHRYWRSFNL